jgi:hypothetical protein
LHPFDCNSDSSSMKSLQFYHQMLLACVHLLQPHSICLTFYRILIQPCWINPSMFPKTLQQTLLLPTPSWHKLLYFFFCWNVVFHANFFYFFMFWRWVFLFARAFWSQPQVQERYSYFLEWSREYFDCLKIVFGCHCELYK